MKKNYITPVTEVIKASAESHLLAGSGNGDSSDPTKVFDNTMESDDLTLD